MPTYFSWGVFSLFAYLVSHISVQIGKFRRSISKSPYWSESPTRLRYGQKAIVRPALSTIFGALVVIAITAGFIAHYTRGIDANMVKIIDGLSLFVAAFITLSVSRKCPEWTGLYYSHLLKHADTGQSLRVLKFNVFLGIGRQFSRVYFMLLPFYCGANAAIIPISSLVGFVFGIVINGCVYLCRQCSTKELKVYATFGLTSFMVMFSTAVFSRGCMYVQSVWGVNIHQRKVIVVVASCLIWFALAIGIHGLMYHYHRTKKRKDDGHDSFESSTRKGRAATNASLSEGDRGQSDLPSTRDRMATSLFFSAWQKKRIKEEEKVKAVATLSFISEDQGRADIESLTAENVTQDQASKDDKVRSDVKEGGNIASSDNGNDASTIEFDKGKEQEAEPSYCSLIWVAVRCSYYGADDSTCLDRLLHYLSSMLWAIIILSFLSFVIINIGAQKQVRTTNAKYPLAELELYSNMNEGEVCAFNDLGAQSNITTFANKDAAHAEGFKILHCGACAACSSWHNMRLEWATRNYLAAESSRCAKKSLAGGKQAVFDCLQSEPIGFGPLCADAWTDVVLCAKENCAFIFLQSSLINKVGNFNVAAGEITSARCEEANCEAGVDGFVARSGATRRRMNIVSTIKRPKNQQCAIVDVDWTELFGDCCATPQEYHEQSPAWEKVPTQ